MATMYCGLCRRAVDARRQVGVGTAILAVFTAGLSLLAIPFYPQRCSICKSTALSRVGPQQTLPGDASGAHLVTLEQRLRRAEADMEAATVEMERLAEERDFYRKLLDDPDRRGDRSG
jgi:hypothetical protein